MATADTIQIINTINSRIDQTIQTILARIGQSDSQLIGVINTGNNQVLQQSNALLQNVNNQIQSRLNSITAQIVNTQQALAANIIAVNQAINQQQITLQESLQSKTIANVQTIAAQINSQNQALNARVIDIIKGTNEQVNYNIKSTGSQIIDKVIASLPVNSSNGQGFDLSQLLQGDFINNIITEVFHVLFDIDISHQETHSGILEDALQPFVDSIHSQSEKISAVFNNATNGKYATLNDLLEAFYSVGVNHTLVDIAVFLSQLVPSVLKIGSILTAPFFTRLEQVARAQYGLNQIDASTLADLYHRHWISYDEYFKGLRKLGYSENDTNILVSGSNIPSTLEALRLLHYRGGLPKQAVIDSVNKLPLSTDDKKAFSLSLDQIPGISDLISMAVKEAFSPDIANAFGQYEDYPTQLSGYAAQQGYSEEWSKRYWAAHWDLPSPQMGFEMFHRGIINQDTLNRLLKALDVMPYWRDKIVKLNYALPTRVDIRRMYSEGLINYNDVHKAYKDLGYDDTWAKRLADYAVRYDEEQDAKKAGHISDLTYSTVETAYKRKIINRSEATQKLQLLKYIPKDIDTILKLWDYQEYVRLHPDRVAEEYNKLADITLAAYKRNVLDLSEAINNLVQSGYTETQARNALKVADIENAVAKKADIINAISSQFYEGIIDQITVQQYLTTLKFNVGEITDIINNLVIMRNLKKNRPTKSELVSMAKQGIISIDDLRTQLRAMNYDDIWIEPLIALTGLE